MNFSIDQLMSIIGNKEVEIISLRMQLALASARLQKAESIITPKQREKLDSKGGNNGAT